MDWTECAMSTISYPLVTGRLRPHGRRRVGRASNVPRHLSHRQSIDVWRELGAIRTPAATVPRLTTLLMLRDYHGRDHAAALPPGVRFAGNTWEGHPDLVWGVRRRLLNRA